MQDCLKKSYKWYKKLQNPMSAIINKVDFIATQGKFDKQRFLNLGYNDNNIQVFGNIKYNLILPEDLEQKSSLYKKTLATDGPILIAASTHAGEEEIILNIYRKLKKSFPNLLLILAPRHPERFNSVYKLAINTGFRITKYTDLNFEHQPHNNSVDILLLNTLGKLLYFYNIADLAYIGGSFVGIGGHNPIEAAALKTPIIMGPSYYNFLDVVHDLQEHHGMVIVQKAENLETTIINFVE